MSNLNSLLDLANDAASTAGVDMSETSTGGGGRRVLEPDFYMARFVEYIEYGKQHNQFDPKKDPKPTMKLGFAVFETGNEHPVFIRSFSLAIGNNEKNTSKIIFDRMNYKGGAKHFAQLLGQGFIVPVIVDKNGYNRINFKEIRPPFDAMSKQPYPVPEATDDMFKLFLWNKPTKETWDSLFIEGQREDGTSKNFVQEDILKAADFEGSALQHMLGGAGQAPAPQAAAEPPAPTAEPEAPAAPEVPAMPEMPKMPDFGGGE